MNKKYMFGFLALLAVSLVAAGYYSIATITLNINQPITIDGKLIQSENCNAGEICLGTPIKISNDANKNRVVTVTNDNTDDDIDVGYVGKLKLVNKDLVNWSIEKPGDGQATIYYTVLDDTFSWRYKSSSVIDRNDYTLIYYMDDKSNTDDTDRLITLGSGDGTITTKLPLWADWNRVKGDYCNFANGFDDYLHCNGAKLWLIPTTAITGSTVDWSQAGKFLFETDLIWYSDSETELTVPANSFIEFYPQFTIDEHASGGTADIEITIA